MKNKKYAKFINATLVQTARLIPLRIGKFAFETSLFGTKPYETNINIPFFDNEKEAYEWIEKQEKWTLQEERTMTLEQYLKDSNIDQIKNDAEFCETEHDLIAEYFQTYPVSKEDKQLAESKGYDTAYFEQ
jgi:hypothetical protein